MHHTVPVDQRSDDGTNISSVHTSAALIEMSIIEELDLKFGSAKNKHQIVHALEHSTVLHRIPLPTPNTTSDQARKDFRRERVLLNDVPFIPDKVDVDRCNAFASTLNVLLERMMRRPELFDRELYADAEAISDAVLQRACRTGAGADSFFMVQKLLCVEGTFVTQRAFLSDPPIKIDVFVADPEPEYDYSVSSNKKLPIVPNHPSGKVSGVGIATNRSESIDSSAGGSDRGPSPDRYNTTNMNNNSSQHGRAHSSPTPPSTPPAVRHAHHMQKSGSQEKHHRTMPSPLKLSLKNLGFGSKTSKPFHAQGLGVAESSALSPPTSPSPGIYDAFSSHGAGGGGGGGSSGAICARVQVMNCFAIYDVSAIEDLTGVPSQDPDPWLEVEAIVVDESNFKTDRHWRKLQLIATCPATGKVYTSSHDASNNIRVSGRLSGRMILQELTSWFTSFPHAPSSHHPHSHGSSNNNMPVPPAGQSSNAHSGGGNAHYNTSNNNTSVSPGPSATSHNHNHSSASSSTDHRGPSGNNHNNISNTNNTNNIDSLLLSTSSTAASLSGQASSTSPTPSVSTTLSTLRSSSTPTGPDSISCSPYTGRSSPALLGLSVLIPVSENNTTISAHPAALPPGVGALSPPYSSGGSTGTHRHQQHINRFSTRGEESAKEVEARHQALHQAALAALQATSPTASSVPSGGPSPQPATPQPQAHAQAQAPPQPQQHQQHQPETQHPVFAKRAHLQDTDSDTEPFGTDRCSGTDNGTDDCGDHSPGDSITEPGTGTGISSVRVSVRSASSSTAGAAPILATHASAMPVRTHEELDLLIPALRSMPGSSTGGSFSRYYSDIPFAGSRDSEDSSAPEQGSISSSVGSAVATRAHSVAGDNDALQS